MRKRIYGRTEKERQQDIIKHMSMTPADLKKMKRETPKNENPVKWEAWGICDMCHIEVRAEYLCEAPVAKLFNREWFLRGTSFVCPRCARKIRKEENKVDSSC